MIAHDQYRVAFDQKGYEWWFPALGLIFVAIGAALIARSDFTSWKHWLAEQGISIELQKTWKYGGEALYFRDPDGHLLEVVTPGVWSIY